MFKLLLLLLLSGFSCAELPPQQQQAEELQTEHYDGRSFFFLGTLFRRWRDRWLAFHNPGPLYAGAAFPLNGYYNCPSFGCNPAGIAPQPGYYPAYYATPLQQQQQQQQQSAQGNSNVYIYQTDQNNANSPYGSGFFGPARQPLPPLPPPPPPPPLPQLPLPPLPPPMATLPPQAAASASSNFGFATAPIGVPGLGPVPAFGCGPNPLACSLGSFG